MQKWERCLWLIDLFSSYGELSLREVNERFMRYSRNEMGESLSERMFLRDREYIASTFQLDIEYDGHIRKYRLNNREVIRQNPLYRYLLSSMHVENMSELLVRNRRPGRSGCASCWTRSRGGGPSFSITGLII